MGKIKEIKINGRCLKVKELKLFDQAIYSVHLNSSKTTLKINLNKEESFISYEINIGIIKFLWHHESKKYEGTIIESLYDLTKNMAYKTIIKVIIVDYDKPEIAGNYDPYFL